MRKNKKIQTLLALTLFSFSQICSANLDSQTTETQNKVSEVQQTLDNKQARLAQTQAEINRLRKELQPLREDIYTLAGQLKNIEKSKELTTAKIENLQLQIDKKEIEVGQTLEMQDYYKVQLSQEKRNLAKYAKLLYQIESQYIDFNEKEINPYKLLLADGSISDTAQSLEYLNVTQKITQQILQKIDHSQEIVNIKQEEIDQDRRELAELKKEVDGEKANLEAQIAASEELLNFTRGKEEEYQKMLEQALKEQEETASAVKKLRVDSAYLTQKLSELNAKRAEMQANAVDQTVHYEDLTKLTNALDGKHSTLNWPVDPSEGITAYFHDESYKAVFGVPHEAIDIRAYQGTEVQAPADGIVYKVKDNGMGYSYIILAHNNNIMTVYGHISQIEVKEGDLVMQGQTIGLSGGMPGTKGAGPMTTGPHLHFEVYDNGIHENPLDYLDLQKLPEDYIPEEYLK